MLGRSATKKHYYSYCCCCCCSCDNGGKISKLNLRPRKIPIHNLKQFLERIYDSCRILNTSLSRTVERKKLMISKLLIF